jgi:pimeloyl-ACP methyl ester carboxylesterase
MFLFNRHVPLIVLFAAVGVCCQPEPEATSASRTGTVASSDGVAIAYEVRGSGSPGLVFVHGWSCDRSYWDAQVDHFAADHTVVTLDLAGHGQSGRERQSWTMEAFGEDVVAVVQALDIDPVILIGHSMGGPVILEAARRMPDRVVGVVGVDTYQEFDRVYGPEEFERFLAPLRADFPANTRAFVSSTMFLPSADSALVNEVASDMSAAPPEIALAALDGLGRWHNEQSGGALAAVRAPIRAINSDYQPTNVEGARRYAGSFEVEFMTGVGHFVMMEDPETFNRLLAETIAELAAEARR